MPKGNFLGFPVFCLAPHLPALSGLLAVFLLCWGFGLWAWRPFRFALALFLFFSVVTVKAFFMSVTTFFVSLNCCLVDFRLRPFRLRWFLSIGTSVVCQCFFLLVTKKKYSLLFSACYSKACYQGSLALVSVCGLAFPAPLPFSAPFPCRLCALVAPSMAICALALALCSAPFPAPLWLVCGQALPSICGQACNHIDRQACHALPCHACALALVSVCLWACLPCSHAMPCLSIPTCQLG